MAINDIDLILHIVHREVTSTNVGSSSKYINTVHPGSNKKIQGWIWDERQWPSEFELLEENSVPSIYDADEDSVSESSWQSGIGSNRDLKVLDISRHKNDSDLEIWLPRVYKGHYYVNNKEWYLFGDDYVAQHFNKGVTTSGLQYVDLAFKPKPSDPIYVRRFKYDRTKNEYTVDKNFRKKVNFSGTSVSGERADTTDTDGAILTNKLDTSLDEFIVDYDYGSTPRVLINKDVSEGVGQEVVISGAGADASIVSTLEKLGVSDGTRSTYQTKYSPIDPSGDIQLLTYEIGKPYRPTEWSLLGDSSDFDVGSGLQYKVDNVLGLIQFGDYDTTTASGSGLIPTKGHQVALRYTKGLLVEYDPEYSRNWSLHIDADTSPLNRSSEQGFVRLSTKREVPKSIVLTADLTGSTSAGYTGTIGNIPVELTATVKDAQSNLLEDADVVFEILPPESGTFTSGGLKTTASTNSDGKAITFLTPPLTIDNIGAVTDDVTISGGFTIMTFSGINIPSTVSGVTLYRVKTYDPVIGIAASGLNQFYQNFIEDESIDENPDTLSATPEYEAFRRASQDLSVPTTYDSTDPTTLSIGPKILVYENDPTSIDPNWGIEKDAVQAPIVPSSFSNVGTTNNPLLKVLYNSVLALPGSDTFFKAYFAVTSAKGRVRAYVKDKFNNSRVYSNTINIDFTPQDKQNGTFTCTTDTDVESGLFKPVKNIDDVPDADIIATSGELTSVYVEDRCIETSQKSYDEYTAIDSTLALYHFTDGSVLDATDNNFDGINNGLTTIEGFIGDGLKAAGGIDHFVASGIIENIDFKGGTIELHYRTLTSGETLAPSTNDLRYLTIFTASGNNVDNEIGIAVENDATYGRGLTFRYEASGLAVYDGVDGKRPLIDLDAITHPVLEDGQWHQIKMTWEWTESDPAVDPPVGQVDVNGYIDNVLLATASGIGIPEHSFLSGPASGVNDNVIGSYTHTSTTSTAPGRYDEIRISNDVISGDSRLPLKYDRTFETYVEWYRRSQKGNSKSLGLTDGVVHSGNCPNRIPVGFRLKSSGIDVASKLNSLTYLSVNNILQSGYFDGGSCSQL